MKHIYWLVVFIFLSPTIVGATNHPVPNDTQAQDQAQSQQQNQNLSTGDQSVVVDSGADQQNTQDVNVTVEMNNNYNSKFSGIEPICWRSNLYSPLFNLNGKHNVSLSFDYYLQHAKGAPVLIEWDNDIPELEVLIGEAEKAKQLIVKYFNNTGRDKTSGDKTNGVARC